MVHLIINQPNYPILLSRWKFFDDLNFEQFSNKIIQRTIQTDFILFLAVHRGSALSYTLGTPPLPPKYDETPLGPQGPPDKS